MEDHIIKQSGLFWWSKREIPEGHFAPDNPVPGTLEISKNGFTSLNLDGFLSEGHPVKNMLRGVNRNVDPIQGVLKNGEYVLLIEPRINGTRMSTKGISYEKISAEDCLVSSSALPAYTENSLFRGVEISLQDLDNWIDKESINIKRTKKSLYLNYTPPKTIKHTIREGHLEISHDLHAPWHSTSSRNAELKQITKITIKSRKNQSFTWLTEMASRLEELIVILIGRSCNMDWPSALLGKELQKCKYYFHRAKNLNYSESPKREEISIRLSTIQHNLGNLFDAWIENREIYGPGFYLYLGNLRSETNYAENKFVNFIWGLEALHRKSEYPENTNPRLDEKIERILNAVNEKDRRWLKDKFKNIKEPSLKERLIDLISEVPVNFDARELEDFCKACADRRNDISHFGGNRTNVSYGDFAQEIMVKSEAIKHIYQILIFKRIGVDDNIIKELIFRSRKSSTISMRLRNAGLNFSELQQQ